jgi:hypothetical protein
MDQDRFFTHSGRRFRLLSSREEIERQMTPFNPTARIKLRLNELTCLLHDSYETTWASFCYHHTACKKCSKERNTSYAHIYYQALLNYFKQDYFVEYPIKIDKRTSYRVDFKLATKPNYVEIDSSIHVKGWDTKRREDYIARDRKKDLKLNGNLERIRLYDDQYRALPISTQLNVIEEAFIKRATNNGLSICRDKIDAAKRDARFFKNSRISGLIKKIRYYHGGHIEFNSKRDIEILNTRTTNETEFYCTVNREVFKRNIQTVFRSHFYCPICLERIRDGVQDNYVMNEEKIAGIKEHIESKFRQRFNIERWKQIPGAFYYRTIVFPIWDKYLSKEIFIPLRDLLSFSLKELAKNIKIGRYDQHRTKRPPERRSTPHKRYDAIPIAGTSPDDRVLYNRKGTQLFDNYQRNAKNINRLMRGEGDDEYLDKLIAANEKEFKVFFHKTGREARQKLAVFDRKIVPFFSEQSKFELYTSRIRYVCGNQFLLVKDSKCGHLFYVSWNYVKAKMNKGQCPVQCQRKECFHRYYLATNPEPRKIPQENILKAFKKMFCGQYYPAFPNRKIMIKTPIRLIHLPSGLRFWASFDNFKRGKFRSEFRDLKLKEIRARFPRWKK